MFPTTYHLHALLRLNFHLRDMTALLVVLTYDTDKFTAGLFFSISNFRLAVNVV